MALRYLIPALAIAGRAVAQCSNAATTTLQSQGDATALASCSTYSGSIAFATSTPNEISLNGIQRIEGSLIVNGASALTALSAPDLRQIDDTFELKDCSQLSSLMFPVLTTVKTIGWVGLASLQGLSFTTGVSMAQTLFIENTMLGSLEGIALEVVDTIKLISNGYLNEINMPLGNISNDLTIQANGRDVSLILPNLIWANNMNIQNASTINLDSLSIVNGTLGFYSNFVDSISCPNLTTVGQTLAIDANAELSKVSMPELNTVTGGLQIQNNTKYDSVAFPQLKTVGGAVDMYGNFDSVTFASLHEVRGGFTIISSKDITTDCNHFKSISGSTSIIHTTPNCQGGVVGASKKGGSSSGTSTSNSASSSSSSPANAVLISGATGLLGVVAAMFGML